ncbi:unnamed protein product [Acanthoscelides obtectus]|uniref:Uncharacterized protein n=1 Tax=Acanthoscelides obtectus TaxID=200917 RepID=A0A9P0PBL1_ACAOB|nr:unnamed protein product [Acanthoscelides obtectus]CAK1641891.1 hypothetical protein AOBTE_LOCUS12700 [Acanthoscelides obtectus]
MPPFRLEHIPYNPSERVRKSIYHSKKIYSPGVKVSNWESHQFCQPVDNDPCNPKCPNLHLSHYNQLGWYEDVEWTTTTGDALQQIYSRRKELEVNPHKTIINLHRKLNSTGGTGKFRDDDYKDQTKRLQQYKQGRQVSYNPCTGEYSDGTPGFVEQFNCVPISY